MVVARVRGWWVSLGDRWDYIADNPLALPASPKSQADNRSMNIRKSRNDIVFAQAMAYSYS